LWNTKPTQSARAGGPAFGFELIGSAERVPTTFPSLGRTVDACNRASSRHRDGGQTRH
jgi:hypothetical protein